jgi:hypothetical protein
MVSGDTRVSFPALDTDTAVAQTVKVLLRTHTTVDTATIHPITQAIRHTQEQAVAIRMPRTTSHPVNQTIAWALPLPLQAATLASECIEQEQCLAHLVMSQQRGLLVVWLGWELG